MAIPQEIARTTKLREDAVHTLDKTTGLLTDGESPLVYGERDCPDVPFCGGDPRTVKGGCRKDGEAIFAGRLGDGAAGSDTGGIAGAEPDGLREWEAGLLSAAETAEGEPWVPAAAWEEYP